MPGPSCKTLEFCRSAVLDCPRQSERLSSGDAPRLFPCSDLAGIMAVRGELSFKPPPPSHGMTRDTGRYIYCPVRISTVGLVKLVLGLAIYSPSSRLTMSTTMLPLRRLTVAASRTRPHTVLRPLTRAFLQTTRAASNMSLATLDVSLWQALLGDMHEC
jgi:hypothetical protein